MRLIPHRLTARLVFSHLLVGLISIGLISGIAGYFIIDRGRREVENFLEDTAFLVSNQLEEPMIEAGGTGEYSQRLQQVVDQFFPERPDIRYTLFLNSGKIISTNEPELPDKNSNEILQEVNQALKGMDGEIRRKDSTFQDVFYVAVPINHDHVVYGALRLSSVYNTHMAASYRSLNLLIIIAILLVIAVVIEAFWLASSLARPIRS
jgi:hypothetical protein